MTNYLTVTPLEPTYRVMLTERKSPGPAPKRRVITPHGEFAGIREASDSIGMTRQGIWINCKRKREGWRFVDQATPDWLTWNVEEAAE